MECRVLCTIATVLVLAGTAALRAQPTGSVNPNEGWKLTTQSKGVAIHARPHPGSSLKEFRAVGEIDAPSGTVHAVIDDLENYSSFMPYTAECRLIKRESDSIITYQRLSPKICADRDYTLRVRKKSWPAAEGGLVYLNWWKPANELGPAEKPGVVRVNVCDGGWLLEPSGANKTRASYSVYTDTGGLVPAFLANHVSQIGIGRLFEAVRKQVKNPQYSVANQ